MFSGGTLAFPGIQEYVYLGKQIEVILALPAVCCSLLLSVLRWPYQAGGYMQGQVRCAFETKKFGNSKCMTVGEPF